MANALRYGGTVRPLNFTNGLSQLCKVRDYATSASQNFFEKKEAEL